MARPRGRPAKENRSRDILAAALAVFAEKGFAAARLDDIAARAEVSKGTLYLYFDSKEALFEALVRAAVLPNLERLEGLVTAWNGSSAALLRQMLGVLTGVLREGRITAFPKLIIAEATTFPHLARLYREQVAERGLKLIAGVMERGVASGEFRPVDPTAAARLFIAPVLFIAIWRVTFAQFDDRKLDEAALLATHADLLIRGLLAHPPPEAAR